MNKQEYNRQYYLDNKEKYREYRKKPEVKDRENRRRRDITTIKRSQRGLAKTKSNYIQQNKRGYRVIYYVDGVLKRKDYDVNRRGEIEKARNKAEDFFNNLDL